MGGYYETAGIMRHFIKPSFLYAVVFTSTLLDSLLGRKALSYSAHAETRTVTFDPKCFSRACAMLANTCFSTSSCFLSALVYRGREVHSRFSFAVRGSPSFVPRVLRSCFAVRGSPSFVPRVLRSCFAVRGSCFAIRGSQSFVPRISRLCFAVRAFSFAVRTFSFVLRSSQLVCS